MSQNKIRPPSHSSLRQESEGDLPDMARAPDIGGRQSDEDADSANVGAFAPVQAAAYRATHAEQNRLGLPRRDTEAERALKLYTEALAAYKADYSGTRSERLRIPFLEAKQKMIDLGLMTGEV